MALQTIWDERFSGEHYVFGEKPNAFLVRHASLLASGARVLVPGDGEGRNGVWLARTGMDVLSVDSSAVGLGLRPEVQRKISLGLWELGPVQGKKRIQMLCLRVLNELELVAGNNALPLANLVRYEAGSYSVDLSGVRQLVDVATKGDGRYTPSNARREARKLGTQALHERWRKEYRALKKSRPDMSDVWYSQQIAKTDIGPQRSAETIRKHMTR